MKKQILSLIVNAAVLTTSPVFAMELEDPRISPSQKSLKISPSQNSLEEHCYRELILRGKKGDIPAQDELMRRYYLKLLPNDDNGKFLVNPIKSLDLQRMNFLSWENLKERSKENDFLAYFIVTQGKETQAHFPELLEKIKVRAEQNIPVALWLMGSIYQYGWNVDQDQNEALKYFMGSAELGFAHGQLALGHMYYNGQGVGGPSEANDKEAHKYFTLAANQGLAAAHNDLGMLYYKGRGVGGISDANRKEAFKYTKLAVEQGSLPACHTLSVMFYRGHGVGGVSAANRKEFLHYTKLSAEKGHHTKQDSLAGLYKDGVLGVEKNLVEALRWYIKAEQKHRVLSDSFLQHCPFIPVDGNESVTDLTDEIVENLNPLVCRYQIKMQENNPQGWNKFAIPQLYEPYIKVEQVVGDLLCNIQYVKAGCLMTGFSVAAELKNSLPQQSTPHFFSMDDIEGTTYLTIGEKNVPVVKKLITSLNQCSKIDKTLHSISQLYQKGYKMALSHLMREQLSAQQTKDKEPSTIEKFKQLSLKVSHIEQQVKQESDQIEQDRLNLKKVETKIKSFIQLGASDRKQEFLEDDEYSFLK